MSVALNSVLSTKARRQLAIARLKATARSRVTPKAPEDSPEEWCKVVFPSLKLSPGGPRHHRLWSWAQELQRFDRPTPFVAIWPRGAGKSTTAELASVYAGATQKRFYVWYVSGTQALADLHVESIASLLESPTFERFYPAMASRKLGKFGNSRGWRRNRLRCANGVTFDALGLDVGVRGMKVEEQRPDLIILDDIDDAFASSKTVQKRIDVITSSVLPAGSTDVAILGIQNMVRPDGFFGRIASGDADYLRGCILDGPHPAIRDLTVGFAEDGSVVFETGEATWPEGQSLELCAQQISDWGLTAFMREAQHDVRNLNSLFAHVQFKRILKKDLPDMVRTVVVVDPAVTSNDNSDSHGVAVAGVDQDDNVYHLYSVERVMAPAESIRTAILLAQRFGSREVHVEVNQGGDMWEFLFNNVIRDLRFENALDETLGEPTFHSVHATAAMGGKVERAQSMLGDYERGVIYHAINDERTHKLLEEGLLRFPERKPFDLVDATVHAHTLLRKGFTRLFA